MFVNEDGRSVPNVRFLLLDTKSWNVVNFACWRNRSNLWKNEEKEPETED